MGAPQIAPLFQDVRAAVAGVRSQLLQPQAFRGEEAVGLLKQALQAFETIQSSLRSRSLSAEETDALRAELDALAQEIARAARLARAGAEHTAGWLAWLAMHFQGYGTTGEVNGFPLSGRVEAEG